jgi:hypothetical protein
MARAKLAPNLPDWMVEHTNRYLSSGGTDGPCTITTWSAGDDRSVVLLTTKGRVRRNSYFRCSTGTRQLFVVASRRSPQHPGWYRNILAAQRSGSGRDQEDSGAGADRHGRGTDAALGRGAEILAPLCRVSAQDRARDPGGRVGSRR